MRKNFIIFLFISLFAVSCIGLVRAEETETAPEEKQEGYSIDEYTAQKILDEGVKGNYVPIEGAENITSANAEDQFYSLIGRWIELILSFIGIILIILMLYAGYLWFSADGNEDKIAQSKGYMINAIIGIGIVLLAYAITYYAMGKISGMIGKL